VGRSRLELGDSDAQHAFRLLRLRHQRPSGGGSGGQAKKFSSPHSRTRVNRAIKEDLRHITRADRLTAKLIERPTQMDICSSRGSVISERSGQRAFIVTSNCGASLKKEGI
jgi:hypothetical protein